MSEQNYHYSIPVKFFNGDKAYTFGSNENNLIKGDLVVVETVRGMELAVVAENPKEGINNNGIPVKPIIRKATKADEDAYERNKKDEYSAMLKCRGAIEKLGLPMDLISAEYTLDRSKVIFTYVADERVDFRELLKELAAIFHIRIELKQIGPRDKAKMVGGIGMCGQTLCCKRFQKEFGIISINMAKNQLLALNPQKLSGQCGKLMCCLAYENDDYKILREGLPKLNSSIFYQGKRYRIISMNVLENIGKISNNEEYIDLSLDEIKELAESSKNLGENNAASKELLK